MDEKTLEEDNARDAEILMNLTGSKLYFLGMNLPPEAWIDVEYSSLQKAHSAVSGCGNKARCTGHQNDFVIHRWINARGIDTVTVTKEKKHSNLQVLAKMYNGLRTGARSRELELQRLEENADGFDYEKYTGKTEEEQYLADMQNYTVELCQAGKSDDVILSLGVTKEVLAWAKLRVEELRGPKPKAVFLVDENESIYKYDWTEEQVRADEITLGRIIRLRETGTDVNQITEKVFVSDAVVISICDEVDEKAAAKAREKRKEVRENDKKLNPEKYQDKKEEKGEENESC